MQGLRESGVEREGGKTVALKETIKPGSASVLALGASPGYEAYNQMHNPSICKSWQCPSSLISLGRVNRAVLTVTESLVRNILFPGYLQFPARCISSLGQPVKCNSHFTVTLCREPGLSQDAHRQAYFLWTHVSLASHHRGVCTPEIN